MSADLTGTDKLIKMMEDVQEKLMGAGEAALYQIAANIITESIQETPVDTGALRGSGFASMPFRESKTSSVLTIGFGGPAKDYAVVVHENPRWHHEVGNYKYLERPALRAAGNFERNMAMLTKRNFKAGKTDVKPRRGIPLDPDSGKAKPLRKGRKKK